MKIKVEQTYEEYNEYHVEDENDNPNYKYFRCYFDLMIRKPPSMLSRKQLYVMHDYHADHTIVKINIQRIVCVVIKVVPFKNKPGLATICSACNRTLLFYYISDGCRSVDANENASEFLSCKHVYPVISSMLAYLDYDANSPQLVNELMDYVLQNVTKEEDELKPNSLLLPNLDYQTKRGQLLLYLSEKFELSILYYGLSPRSRVWRFYCMDCQDACNCRHVNAFTTSDHGKKLIYNKDAARPDFSVPGSCY